MKRSKITLAALSVAIVASISFFSCTKSSSSSTSPYTMTATKGGSSTSFSGQSNVVAVISGPLLEVEGISVSGGDTTGYIIIINNYAGVGSYALDGMTEYVSKTSSSASVLQCSHGNLTITSATSPNMSGIFYFTATDSTKITNGTFTAKF